jgi:hypothetical protein
LNYLEILSDESGHSRPAELLSSRIEECIGSHEECTCAPLHRLAKAMSISVGVLALKI